MNDMVSVIVPVYNRQTVLEECVRSILNQTYRNLEIVLIDDGSADGTPALCRKLAEQERRIVFLESEHAGVSAARNIGLEAARGEYLFFADSDDVIHPRLLETFVCGLRDSDAAIAASGIVNVSEKNWHKVAERLNTSDETGELMYYSNGEALRMMLCESCPLSAIGGVMLRRDLVGETRFRTDLFIGEDFYFIYENMIKGIHALFLKQKWYYARLHQNNSSWNYEYDGFWTRFYRRQLVWESEEARGYREYANCQKRNVLGIFINCQNRCGWRTEDCQRMRMIMRDYRKVLVPALSVKDRLRFALSVYAPPVYELLRWLKAQIKIRMISLL